VWGAWSLESRLAVLASPLESKKIGGKGKREIRGEEGKEKTWDRMIEAFDSKRIT